MAEYKVVALIEVASMHGLIESECRPVATFSSMERAAEAVDQIEDMMKGEGE